MVNRLRRGLFLSSRSISIDTYAYFQIKPEDTIDFNEKDFGETNSGYISYTSFTYNGKTYIEVNQLPELIIRIKPGTYFQAKILNFLHEAYVKGKFSFLLEKINYVWEYFEGEKIQEIDAKFEELLSYTTFQLFCLKIRDLTRFGYFKEKTVVRRAERNVFPIEDIFNPIIGTLFNTFEQMDGGRALDTSIMESGVRMGMYGTGIRIEETNQVVPKPNNSLSMNNLLPYLTGNALLDDRTKISFAYSQFDINNMP